MKQRWFQNMEVQIMFDRLDTEQSAQAKKILEDEALRTQAAWCMIEQEHDTDIDSIHLLVATVLEDEKLTKEAVWFLVYKEAHTLNESHKLLKKLHYSKEKSRLKNSTKNKERKMDNPKQEKKPLSDKQVELALLRKEDALHQADRYKDYLENQDHHFFLNRPPFFITHTRSFNKILKDEWKARQDQKPVEIQEKTQTHEQHAVHEESAGMKL